jgi:AcrR family transcriptional regulator
MATKDDILAEARRQALKLGYANIRRDEIARALDIAAGGVSYHWRDMGKLRAAVIRAAIDAEDLPIIAQAITARHVAARNIPDALKRRALVAAAG